MPQVTEEQPHPGFRVTGWGKGVKPYHFHGKTQVAWKFSEFSKRKYYRPGDSIRDLFISDRWRSPTTIWKGHFFTIPKRSPAELPGPLLLDGGNFLQLAMFFRSGGHCKFLGFFCMRIYSYQVIQGAETPYRNECGSPEPFHPQKVDSSSYFLHAPCECLVPQIFNKKRYQKMKQFCGIIPTTLTSFFSWINHEKKACLKPTTWQVWWPFWDG